MTRRVIRVDRLIAVLGVAVLVLGGLVFWIISRQALNHDEPTPAQRAQTQIRRIEPTWRVRYTEESRTPGVLCGYAGPGRQGQDGEDVIFISRPNRLLLQTDPLKSEFDRDLRALCPGFLTPPPSPVLP